MSRVNAVDILDLIKKEQIEFVDFRFTDTFGQNHHITYDAQYVSEEHLVKGITFDGSSIANWKNIEASDMIILPDLGTNFCDPFMVQKTLVIFCDVIDPQTAKGYNRDPRTIARKAEDYLKSSGLGDKVFFGPELEFFIFDDVKFQFSPNSASYSVDSEEGPYNSARNYEVGNMGHRPDYKGGYFPVPPKDSLHNLRGEITSVLKEVGVESILHHHEVAASQCEVGFKHSTLVDIADSVQKLKYIVQNVALSYGKTATFMPKPIQGDNGSGMHVHQSIWKDGNTLFYGSEENSLSELCLYYIGGIIKHAKAINAFANPTANSYKRLVPGFEAPTILAYSAANRSAAIRIPYVHTPQATRIETRFPDPSANPYLAFAALLMAGIDGIKNKIHPGKPEDKNLYTLSRKENKKFPKVARDLREALEALDHDREFLKQGGVFDDDAINAYIDLKMKEVERLEGSPHPLEFKLYYSS